MVLNFLLCSESKNISQRELDEMQRPLEENAAHCADIWGLPPPCVEVIDDVRKLSQLNRRSRHYAPVVFLDDDPSEDATTLAYHYNDPVVLLPAARVFVNRASGFHTGPYSVFENAAHEILESLCNPDLRVWSAHPDPSRHVDIPQEVCDPTQNTYSIAYNGTTWPAANFVTPEWYLTSFFIDAELRKQLFAAGRGFDYLKTFRMPGEISAEGYTVLRERKTDIISSEAKLPGKSWIPRTAIERRAKLHPWSRSHRLGLRV